MAPIVSARGTAGFAQRIQLHFQMSGNTGIKKKELHSQASGIEELIAVLPLCSLWYSRQPANLTPHNVSAELPAVTLICDLQRCGCVKWCLPCVL